ncbi:MAG: hypothetical protein HKO62_11340, partial [Gammaproteobacteria bacterium]|nr:hypothetical protein [Gammaproteobacteria bacterium]
PGGDETPAAAGDTAAPSAGGALTWQSTTAMYACDALVRHAMPLQEAGDDDDGSVLMHPDSLAAAGVADGTTVRVSAGSVGFVASCHGSTQVAPGTVFGFAGRYRGTLATGTAVEIASA